MGGKNLRAEGPQIYSQAQIHRQIHSPLGLSDLQSDLQLQMIYLDKSADLLWILSQVLRGAALKNFGVARLLYFFGAARLLNFFGVARR